MTERRNMSVITLWGRRLIAALLLAAFVSLLPIRAQAASESYVVTASTLYVRKSASLNSAKIASLKKGAKVTVVGSEKDFYRIKVNGKTGYVAKKYLAKPSASKKTAVQPIKATAGYMKSNAPLYASYSASSKKLATLAKGSKVTLIGQTASYYKAKNAAGKIGYIRKTSITKSKPASAATSVASAQKRLIKLGYLSSKGATGKLDSATKAALRTFQLQAGLAINGKLDASTARRLSAASAPRKRAVVTMDWFKSGVNGMFRKGSTATIVDCYTGARIRIRRVQGTNHADVEPAAASDTAKLKRIYGGKWSWSTRPVILILGGKYIAASINGMPHGNGISKTNGFDGQFCLHTTNSKTHASDSQSRDHQGKVSIASKYYK